MSRIIGTVFPKNSKPIKIRQDMHAQPDGHYEIQDKEKRAEYEKLKNNNEE